MLSKNNVNKNKGACDFALFFNARRGICKDVRARRHW